MAGMWRVQRVGLPIPAWQRPALRAYYPRGASTPAVVPYGRGFPDVALMAGGPAVATRARRADDGAGLSRAGQRHPGSTFAAEPAVSAPIWAAFLALANQARRATGLPRLGCPHPLCIASPIRRRARFARSIHGNSDVALYAVNDQGHAVNYELRGYECRRGWNPVTGLGVPTSRR
jgi:kumamolisin